MNPLQRYATRGHREVQGWLSEVAISLLLDLARIQEAHRVSGPVCEIGVHHGRLFILLHLLTRGSERSVAWDLFEHQDENVDRSGRGNRERFMANLERHRCDLTRIAAIAANSLRLTPADVTGACGGEPRIFSIDGGHTPEITRSDLALAARSVREDGLIVLDDFFNQAWPGVAEGTCRYFADPPVPLYPVVIGGNKFIFARNPQMADRYREELAPSSRLRRREAVAFGHQVAVFESPEEPFGARLLGAERLRRLRKSRVGRTVRRLGRLVEKAKDRAGV